MKDLWHVYLKTSWLPAIHSLIRASSEEEAKYHFEIMIGPLKDVVIENLGPISPMKWEQNGS